MGRWCNQLTARRNIIYQGYGEASMGRRTLTIVDVIAILVHWHTGQSQSEIAAALRLDRKTVRKYLRPARAMGLYPGRTSLSPEEWARLVRTWFPELAD